MRAIFSPAPRTGIGTTGSALAATVDGRRAGAVSYGDVVRYRDADYWIIQASVADGTMFRVTAVDGLTWSAIRAAEFRAREAVAA